MIKTFLNLFRKKYKGWIHWQLVDGTRIVKSGTFYCATKRTKHELKELIHRNKFEKLKHKSFTLKII